MTKLWVALFLVLTATTAHSDISPGIAWPDSSIPVPSRVQAFIASECVEYQGWSEETVDECISSEKYGYRAVVAMLIDDEFGERAIRRYRGCAAGLGKLGGRFHRRKAECLSAAYCIVWRFEYSEETVLPRLRRAELDAIPNGRSKTLTLAASIVERSYR